MADLTTISSSSILPSFNHLLQIQYYFSILITTYLPPICSSELCNSIFWSSMVTSTFISKTSNPIRYPYPYYQKPDLLTTLDYPLLPYPHLFLNLPQWSNDVSPNLTPTFSHLLELNPVGSASILRYFLLLSLHSRRPNVYHS